MTEETLPQSGTSEPQQTAMSPEAMARFLLRPRVAVLSWVTSEGEVVSTPVWFDYRDGKFFAHSMSGSLKVRSILKNPNVSLCVQDPEPPYRYVTVRAQARVIADPEAGYQLDKQLARRYLGRMGGRFYIERVYPTFPGQSRILELLPTKVSSVNGSAGINPALVLAMRTLRKAGL